jgi:hypothetical protein
MSIENICNYCLVKRLRAEALRRGHYIRIRPSPGTLGGLNVYEVPDATQKYNLRDGQPDHDKYFRCWLMALGDNCTC